MQLQESTRFEIEPSHVDSPANLDSEDKLTALSDFIRLKALDSLTMKLVLRRLALAMRSITERPFHEREWAIRRRGPNVKAPEAQFLYLLARLSKLGKMKSLVRGFGRIRRLSMLRKDLHHFKEVNEAKADSKCNKLQLISAIFNRHQSDHLRMAFDRTVLAFASSSLLGSVASQRSRHAATSLVNLFKRLVLARKKIAITKLQLCFIEKFKQEVTEAKRELVEQRSTIDKSKQDLNNQNTFALSLKAEINKLKSSQATSQLEIQKLSAKNKILETENASLLSKCEALASSGHQLKEDKSHLEQLVDRIRSQYESLQQDYEEKIEAFNQATEDVSKAAAKSSVEKSALSDRIKALIEQLEEDKLSLYKAGSSPV